MNSYQDRREDFKRSDSAAEDRKVLTMLLTAVYSPLLLIVGAAIFLA